MAVQDGREPIGVAQGPGQGGTDYPIVSPSDDIELLLADAFLAYTDNANILVPPFRIKYLYGFGTDSVSVPITPAHTHDIEIVDSNNVTVFDSLAATDFKSELWADRLRILEWTDGTDQILRVVYHTEFGLNDTPRTYDVYIEPTAAQLDGRVPYQLPRRVNSVRVGLVTLKGENIVLKNGFNTTIAAGTPSAIDGQRRTTDIVFGAEAGTGAGRFGPPCDEENPIIRRINNVEPNARGNFLIDASECYRVERPIESELQASPREVQIHDHAIKISNDCGPCCDCDDFIAVWEAIRKLRDTYANLIERTQAARDLYHVNRQRYLDSVACRLNSKLRLIMEPICPGEIGIAAGYCNNSEECLVGLVIHISFAYSDGTGECTGADGSSPLAANTTASFSEVLCNSQFRQNNISPGASEPTRREFYRLAGTWPHFYAYWDEVDPGAMASVTFRIRLDNADESQEVEAIADAFVVGRFPVIQPSGDTLVPGYTTGSGPLSTPDENRLTECPILRSVTPVSECCPELP